MTETASKIFKIVDNEVTIVSIDAALRGSINEVWKRKNASISDPTGKKKEYNFRELIYIYLIADYESYPNSKGYSDTDAHKYALEVTGLPNTWIPDTIVKRAIEEYKDLQADVLKEEINEILKTFRNNTVIVKKISSAITKELNKSTLTKDEIKELIGLQGLLIQMSSDIPKQQAILSTTLEAIRNRGKADEYEFLRGSDEVVPASADPDRRY